MKFMQAIHIKLGKAVIMENREIINAYIDKWIEDYNSRQRAVWNYEDGCVMLGAQYLYEATGDEKYINCIRTFMDRYIQEDGTIRYYVPEDYNLDKVNNGRVLYFLCLLYTSGSEGRKRENSRYCAAVTFFPLL